MTPTTGTKMAGFLLCGLLACGCGSGTEDEGNTSGGGSTYSSGGGGSASADCGSKPHGAYRCSGSMGIEQCINGDWEHVNSCGCSVKVGDPRKPPYSTNCKVMIGAAGSVECSYAFKTCKTCRAGQACSDGSGTDTSGGSGASGGSSTPDDGEESGGGETGGGSSGSCSAAGLTCLSESDCCSGSHCVEYPGMGTYCGAECFGGSACKSGCCVQVNGESYGVCAPASYCN